MKGTEKIRKQYRFWKKVEGYEETPNECLSKEIFCCKSVAALSVNLEFKLYRCWHSVKLCQVLMSNLASTYCSSNFTY